MKRPNRRWINGGASGRPAPEVPESRGAGLRHIHPQEVDHAFSAGPSWTDDSVEITERASRPPGCRRVASRPALRSEAPETP